MKKRILLIEDDTEISELLATLLRAENYQVSSSLDGGEGLKKALNEDFDVIVLDIMLPTLDGLSVLQALRAKRNTPVLMLTARGEDVDRIIGFEMGADDYLPKPFNPRELLARLKALLRRVELDSAPHPHSEKLIVENLTLDPKTHEASVEAQVLDLTGAEFNVLHQLMLKAGEVLTKADLTQQALGRHFSLYDRAIDVHVSNLRKKLSPHLKGCDIKTVRGVGYLLQIPQNEQEIFV